MPIKVLNINKSYIIYLTLSSAGSSTPPRLKYPFLKIQPVLKFIRFKYKNNDNFVFMSIRMLYIASKHWYFFYKT